MLGLGIGVSQPRRSAGGGAPASTWPAASNTGARSTPGTPVSGDVTSTADGQTISGRAVTNGTIIIAHNNVTVQDNSVSTTGAYCVQVQAGKTGAVVQYNDLTGAQTAIQGAGTFHRNDISAVENGVVIAGGNNTNVTYNYIHDLFAAVEPHYDGIAAQGGCNNILIQGNWINGTVSAAIQGIFLTNEFGAADNIVVTENYIGNATYNITAGTGLTTVSVTNNTLQKGSSGFYNFTAVGMTVSGNVSTRGLYIDGGAAPVVGASAFTPSAALSANDANINTSFRTICTLASVGSEYRVVFKASTAAGTLLQGMAAGKRSSGNASALALQELLFGGQSLVAATESIPIGCEIASDWFTPPASLIVGDAMIVGYTMGNPGGTRISTGNTNATTYFKASDGTYDDAAPAGYTLSANSDYGVVRIEAR